MRWFNFNHQQHYSSTMNNATIVLVLFQLAIFACTLKESIGRLDHDFTPSMLSHLNEKIKVFRARSDELSSDVQRAVSDVDGRFLYVFAANQLYQVNATSFDVYAELEVGPAAQSSSSSDATTVIHNQLLLVAGGHILMCIDYKGTCYSRSLRDIRISTMDKESQPGIVNPWPGITSEGYVSNPTGKHDPDEIFLASSYQSVRKVSSRMKLQQSTFSITLSDRKLPDFKLKFKNNFLQSELQIVSSGFGNFKYRLQYRKIFVYNGFVYYALVQTNKKTNQLETRLGRKCVDDPKYASYSDIPIRCETGFGKEHKVLEDVYFGTVGELLLEKHGYTKSDGKRFMIGVFSNSSQLSFDNNEFPKVESSICIFDMYRFEKLFHEAASNEACTGHMLTDMFQYSVEASQCEVKLIDPVFNQCPTKLRSMTAYPIKLESFGLQHNGVQTHATSMTVDIVDHLYTVIIVGTAEGRILKYQIGNEDISMFEQFPLSNGLPINRGMFLIRSPASLVVYSKDKLFKIPTETCDFFSDCKSCTASASPYCGWCVLENRCTRKSSCRHGSQPNAFLQHKCIALTHDLQPRNASLSEKSAGSKVIMEINFLPKISKTETTFKCKFGSMAVSAIFTPPHRIQCHFPARKDRPNVKFGSDFVVVPLSIQSFDNDFTTPVFETNFKFYDCSAHKLCTDCLRSNFECNWCLERNECVDNEPNQCSNSQGGPSRHMPERECPQIVPGEFKYTVPESIEFQIVIPVANLGQYVETNDQRNNLRCKVEVLDSDEHSIVGATYYKNTVKCNAKDYQYSEEQGSKYAKLSILVGKGVLDEATIYLYKCPHLGTDCTTCVNLSGEYECSWCGGSCQFRSQCLTGGITKHQTDRCPAPKIISVWPLVGIKDGGTHVTIRGQDFGWRGKSDVNVMIAAQACEIVPSSANSREITCIAKPDLKNIDSGVVTVKVDDRSVDSLEDFVFVSPTIVKIEPLYGPVSGGTRLKIRGTNLDVGTIRSVLVGESECRIDMDSVSDTEIDCITEKNTLPNKLAAIKLKIDAFSSEYFEKFRFLPDPDVFDVQPRGAFESGGRNHKVIGIDFNSFQKARIVYLDQRYSIVSKKQECQRFNDTLMYCPSPQMEDVEMYGRGARTTMEEKTPIFNTHFAFAPSLKKSDRSKRASEKEFELRVLNVAFLVDDMEKMIDPQITFTVNPDPIIFTFTDNVEQWHPRQPLVIEGMRLNDALDSTEIRVAVGTEFCNITLLTRKRLVCNPPQKKPKPYHSDDDPDVEPLVMVYLGSIVAKPGLLQYSQDVTSVDGLSMGMVGLIVGAAMILVLVAIVLVTIWLRKKSFQAEKDYKRIQMQMDTLESNVRSECKQAFAELQTDMTDLTSDLVALGIPYHAKRVYCHKIMFKEDHPVMSTEWKQTMMKGQSGRAMYELESLLWQKQFVFVMVEVLEQQSDFKAQDRVHVASLLTAVLARNMSYCTDVVMSLLKILIAKSVEGKHPHIMLRRTESVVEKMLANWIALCLYDYLAHSAGSSLFLLVKALKHQIEKGPVDSITGDARYSLSEDRLLKDSLEPHSVTIFIIPPPSDETTLMRNVYGVNNEIQQDDDKMVCRVLSCDSVCQVKSKILDVLYKHHPFSQRPTVHDFDLEWRNSPWGPVTLLDSDDYRGISPTGQSTGSNGSATHLRPSSSSSGDTWKRLRTMDECGISKVATIAVLPKHGSSRFNYSTNLDCSTHTYASIGSSSLLLNSSPDSSVRGTRYWHLVRPEDSSSLTRGVDPRTIKNIPEVYLTRLLATKGTVQKFIDDFFGAALTVNCELPLVVKYLFDFMEREADVHGITDPSVVYAWKNNSLPLRFWVNMIKNPDFIFDIEKTSTLDSCLSVIAQTFMDSCSTSEHKLGKDSPSNKLLFAKDIPRYRQLVSKFYSDIRKLPSVSDNELSARMNELSNIHDDQFDVINSMFELLHYTSKYSLPILDALKNDPISRKQNLPERFQTIVDCAMGGIPLSTKPTLPR